jgi:hypothetical protein
MSGVRRAVGEGERSGALTGGTGLSAGVGGGEATASVRRALTRVGRPRKEKVGRAQMNSKISNLFNQF